MEMKKFVVLLLAVWTLASMLETSWAHLPGGMTYFAFQWPGGFEPVVDGDLSEWDIVPGAYVQNTESLFDLVGGGYTLYDLSDFTVVRSIVGWNDSRNLLYFAAEVFDDVHQVDRPAGQAQFIWQDDDFEIMIDADHSGGQYSVPSDREVDKVLKRFIGSQATHYVMAVPPPDQIAFVSFNASTWTQREPYAQTGWRIKGNLRGESTTFYEIAIMPFDDLDWTGPSKSEVHDLTEWEILGINYCFSDYDSKTDERDAYWSLSGGIYSWLSATHFSDFLLAPVEDLFPTEVGGTTWGRIKSSFLGYGESK